MGTRFDDSGSRSRALFERARRVIPGGTSKANFHVRPHPFYLTEGRGCRVTDADGVERLDAINNFTALIHGHAFPPVVDAVSRQLARGTAFAASTGSPGTRNRSASAIPRAKVASETSSGDTVYHA